MDTEKKQLELDKRYIRMASIWAVSYTHLTLPTKA